MVRSFSAIKSIVTTMRFYAGFVDGRRPTFSTMSSSDGVASGGGMTGGSTGAEPLACACPLPMAGMRGGRSATSVVVAQALDRISRDQEHVAALFKQMIFAGVRIVTLAEGEIGELHVGLKGTMNALFLRGLADKTRRGLKGRIEKGSSGGG